MHQQLYQTNELSKCKFLENGHPSDITCFLSSSFLNQRRSRFGQGKEDQSVEQHIKFHISLYTCFQRGEYSCSLQHGFREDLILPHQEHLTLPQPRKLKRKMVTPPLPLRPGFPHSRSPVSHNEKVQKSKMTDALFRRSLWHQLKDKL